jgi:hypothetical protein
MISVASTGGTVTNYSPRFSLTGMTGVFPANVMAGAKAVTGTDGPPSVNALAGAQAPTAAVSGGLFEVPFYQQEGLTRYAPMQTYPATKITKKTKTPLNPKSPWNVATTYLAIPTIQTTVTQQVTWSFSQAEHTVRDKEQRMAREKLTGYRLLLQQCQQMTCKSF